MHINKSIFKYNDKFKISHISFSLIFTITLFIIYNSVNIEKISHWFIIDGNIDYVPLIAYLFFAWTFFLAFFLFFAHRYLIKFVAIIFIMLSATATYFTAKYNVFIDSTMVMNTFYTDTGEAMGLLSTNMLTYVIFLIIIPIFLVLKAKINFKSRGKHLLSSVLLFIISLSIGVGLVYLNFDAIHRAGNISKKDILYQLVPVNIITGLGGVVQEISAPYFKKNQQDIKITGKVSKQDNIVVVLVIGEAARQKSMSLYGYDRKNTNPVLAKYEGLHLLNGIARLGSTIYALPEILAKNDIKLATITSKLGVKTACYVNYTMYDNCDAVGETRVDNCKYGDKCYDEDVLPLLENNLKNHKSGQSLVILHMGGGSHGPTYKDRHPVEFQAFKPQCDDADVINRCTPEELYNSYDNTILYTDYVLGKIIDTLEQYKNKAPYVFIYLSDHGESLLENGRIFHGMPPGMSLPPEQAQVPLIIKSSIPIEIKKFKEYKQPYVFDTVLDLLSIQTGIFNKDKVFIIKK
ncbi:MAG: hypothetical protein DRQ51_09940 [Gammaproteobacteria bacterium]|nr:MAG: hypothetical protein DRQ51_09940 [Gammaproteobacteria bacterium]